MRKPATLVCVITSITFVLAVFPWAVAWGQQEAPAGQANPPTTIPAWTPPAPNPEEYDWIRLTSGEWLKGGVIQMREETLDFDSDKLEDFSFDWEDIAAIRSARKYTYVFADRTDLTGPAVIEDGKVVISVDGEEHSRDRADLMSIIPDLSRRAKRWDGKASMGFTFRKGNTDQQDFTGQGYLWGGHDAARRAHPFHRTDKGVRSGRVLGLGPCGEPLAQRGRHDSRQGRRKAHPGHRDRFLIPNLTGSTHQK